MPPSSSQLVQSVADVRIIGPRDSTPAKFGLCALLLVAVWVAFGWAVSAPFFYDDHFSIRRNESVRTLWPPTAPLSPPKFLPFSGRPLVNLSAAVNYYFGGYDPVGYRALNITLHAASAMLLFLIARRALKLYRLPQSVFDDESVATALAFAVALIWAVHPLQTDAVCYVTQRTELMMGFFLLATLYCSLRYWETMPEDSQRRWLTLSVAACAAGMACKEVMVAAPPLVLLFERTFFRRDFSNSLRTSWPLHVGLVASYLLLIYLNADLPRSDSAGFHLEVTAATWWLTQCKVLLMYLRLAFWPWPLTIHYEIPYLQSLGDAWPYVLPVALLVLGTIYAIWRAWPVGFVGAWFFLILSPTLIVPVVTEVAAERRMYLPLAAVVVLVVVGAYRLMNVLVRRIAAEPAKTPDRSLLVAIAILVVATPTCVLGAVTWQRLALYQNEATLWRDALRRYPDSETAHLNLGFALMNSGENDAAIEEFRTALRINPNAHEAHFNWGTVLNEQEKTAEAVEHFAAAVALVPNSFDYRRTYGVVLSKVKRYAEAIEQYRRALEIQPDSEVIHFNLGIALKESGQLPEAARQYAEVVRRSPTDVEARNNYGNVLRALKQYPEARKQFEEALRLDPALRSARYNLGLTFDALGRYDQALAQYELLLARYPDDAEGRYAMGNVLSALGRREDAVKQLARAVELDPSLEEAWSNLGAALLDLGRVDEAITQLEQGVASVPNSAVTQFNLAVAYASAGRADQAIAQAEKARTLAVDQGQINVAQQIQAWITNRKSAGADPGSDN